MKFYVLIAAMLGFMAHADEKTCTVKGMHCQGCTESVHGKLCDEAKYSKCEVNILDEKKEIGQVHMVTKDEKALVDEKAVGAILTDAGYKMEKCAKGAPTPSKMKTNPGAKTPPAKG